MNTNAAIANTDESLLSELMQCKPHYRAQSIQPIDTGDAWSSCRWEWLYTPPDGLDPEWLFAALSGNVDLAILEQEIVSDALRWHLQHARPLSINLSLTVLADTAFADWLLRVVNRFRIQVSQVWWEVTEAWPAVDLDVVRNTIDRLQLAGQALALDDISTMDALHRWVDRFGMPEIVKIDRAVLRRRSEDLPSLVDTIHARGATVVIEGVESAEDLALARSCGADYWQGFLAGRPTDIDELERGLG